MLRRKVCEANAAGSFQTASRLLENLAGLRISPKQAQLITQRVGSVLEEERDRATQEFLDPRSRAQPVCDSCPELLVVTADGGRVQTRQDEAAKKWKEDKVGVVYDARPSPEQPGVRYHGPKPITRSVTATLDNWETLGDHLSAMAHRRGYEHAAQKVFISDGSKAIRTFRERCFPDAVFVLDWAHAAGHLHQAAQAAYGTGKKADAWYERQKDRLWEGRTKALIRTLTRLVKKHGKPPGDAPENDPRRILANNLEYFRANREALDYPLFRRKGWPIGSAIIESTIKQVNKRMKGTEKHWSITGAEQTLQVVTHLLTEDDSWDHFWIRCPLACAA